jgi:hypothetical protein
LRGSFKKIGAITAALPTKTRMEITIIKKTFSVFFISKN